MGSSKLTLKYRARSVPITDLLAHLKDGAGARWELPANTSKTYKRHLNAEEKQKTKAGKWHWVEVDNGHNHLLDCEVMQINFASLYKIFNHQEEVKE